MHARPLDQDSIPLSGRRYAKRPPRIAAGGRNLQDRTTLTATVLSTPTPGGGSGVEWLPRIGDLHRGGLVDGRPVTQLSVDVPPHAYNSPLVVSARL